MDQPRLFDARRILVGACAHHRGPTLQADHRYPRSERDVLLVEQNVGHALRICDRGYAMQEGRVVMGGTSSESLDNRHLTDVMLGIAEIAL